LHIFYETGVAGFFRGSGFLFLMWGGLVLCGAVG
jgi:hypothetical protein